MMANDDHIDKGTGVTTTKKYGIAYPDATGGIKALEISEDMKTLAQMIRDAGGDPDTVRIVTPTSTTYDYVPVERD